MHSPAHGLDHGKMAPTPMGLSWMDQRKVGESKCLEWLKHSQPWFAGELPSTSSTALHYMYRPTLYQNPPPHPHKNMLAPLSPALSPSRNVGDIGS